jgi:carbon-monoxide dehydrogenase medium subunit
MFPAAFDYYRAASVDEALSLLAEHPDAKLLAGGHSLLPMMKLRLSQPSAVIDIGRIGALEQIDHHGDRVRIGALATHAAVAASRVVKQHAPLLSEVAVRIADQQVRNRGTVGGNIAHADPASDWPAVILVLDGRIHVSGRGESRTVAASRFFVGLLTTDLQASELITAIDVQATRPRTGCAYLKVEHPASGYAVCGAAALVSVTAAGACAEARVCFNGVAPAAFEAERVASALLGKPLTDDAIDAAVATLTVADPLHDVHYSGEYRVALAKAYGARALKLARDRAR